jgi:t-SNARE complex subunit (syntaxin)
MQSRASGARAAFAEVQSRNQDLRKIEETITQLAQMMQDMATLVLEQDESVKMVEAQAAQVNTDVEQGLDQTKKAVKSARAARRKRWICFFIILIIVIIAVVIGVYYGLVSSFSYSFSPLSPFFSFPLRFSFASIRPHATQTDIQPPPPYCSLFLTSL